jgi:hypothetical protein
MMTKQPKLGLAEMKALLPPVPVLANESQEQFEKIFDQVLVTLKIDDMVELLLIEEFVRPAWEIARYTRHRVVAFDRKFKGYVSDKVSHLRDQQARRAALAQRLAEYLGQRPPEVSHLVKLEDKVMEADVEIAEILKHTPSELAYNRALEQSIGFHKDLEFLITSLTKRRDQALLMLERYREDLGCRAREAVEEILDAEYKVVETPAIENEAEKSEAVATQIPQNAPPLVPSAASAAEATSAVDQSATSGADQLDPASLSASTSEDDSDDRED